MRKEILSGLGLTFGMKFDAQGRLVSPSGTPAPLAGLPGGDEEEDDVDDDGDEDDNGNGDEAKPAVE